MQILSGGIETKLSKKIEFCYLLHVCLGKGVMTVIPMHSLGTFFKIVAYLAEIALHANDQNPSIENCQNREPLVHGATEKGCPKQYLDVMNPMELTIFPSYRFIF